MSSGSSEQNSRHTRLDTWKSIAQHLGRSSRTVQRWHSAYGLPVHHLSGESGSVYAYSDDLDNWLRGRGRTTSVESAESNGSTGAEPVAGLVFSDPSTNHFDSSLISRRALIRSAQLVTLADKSWEAFSHRNLTAILNYYREALDLNPANAEAYAGLSLGLIAEGIFGLVRPPIAYASAKAAAHNALTIAPDLPLARSADAWIKTLVTRDWEQARTEFDALLAAPRLSARALNGRAMLHIAAGELKQASELFLKASHQTPLSSHSLIFFCWTEYLHGEFAYVLHRIREIRATGGFGPVLDTVEALAILQHRSGNARVSQLETLAAESPPYDVIQGALGYAYALNGQRQQAHEVLSAMMERAKGRFNPEPYAFALIFIGLNDNQRAISSLEESFRNGSVWSLGFQSDPVLKALQGETLYQEFLSKAQYPQSATISVNAATRID